MAHPAILIVGAGPVGLTLALSLHRSGVPPNTILIAEQRPSRAPQPLSKALSMSASSLEVFRTLGIVERFLDAGVPIHKAHFGGGARLMDLSYDVLGTRYPYNFSIPQTRTEEILLARCEEVGVGFLWGRRFVALVDDEAADDPPAVVVATLEKPDGTTEPITASWLVGCDGTRSAVRDAARSISWTGTRATRYTWAVDCKVDADAPAILTGADEGGKALMYSLGPGKARFGANYPPSEVVAGQRPAAPDEAYVRARVKRTFGRDFGARDIEWVTVLGDGMWVAGTLRAGRVFVVGDAAHLLFPAGGQGMNTGLLDAANLGWKLARVVTGSIAGKAVVDRVLDSYTTERKPAIDAVVKNIRVQQLVFFSTGVSEQAVADFIAEAFDQPALNRLWATRVTGFGDPTAPYQLGMQLGDELEGQRLTHVSDSNADDVLLATNMNTFILATFRADSGEPVHLDWAEDLLTKHQGQFIELDTVLEATSQKWAGVKAVLLRPDLRVAWVLREESDLSRRKEDLSRILSWWCGTPET